MNITIIGTGYVGLVTGACLAELGNQVFCLDLDQGKIDLLKRRHLPIYEPGLDGLIANNVEADRLSFTTDVAAAVMHGDALFIAVGTPPLEDGSADSLCAECRTRHRPAHDRLQGDRRQVDGASGNRRPGAGGGAARAGRSAASARARRVVAECGFSVVSNPEFLKEGAAVEDFMRPDRIVLGVDEDEAGQRALAVMRRIYAPFNRNHERSRVMDVRSAEFTKYAANAMLATRISFMNELANLADRVGADIELVRQGIGSDPRIGYSFLYAGAGYGGSCFPKDVKALMHTAREPWTVAAHPRGGRGGEPGPASAARGKVFAEFGTDLRERRFAIWGLAFKPNTDDMREAPSRVLISALLRAGARLTAHDPVAQHEAMKALKRDLADRPDLLAHVQFVDKPLDALQSADALIIVTEWKAYKSPNLAALKSRLKQPLIFDGRNLYEPEAMRAAGFRYVAIGRAAPGASAPA